MNSKSIAALGAAVAVLSVIITLSLITYQVTPVISTTITSTPINLKVEGMGPPVYYDQYVLFDVYAFLDDLYGFTEDGRPIYNHIQIEFNPENSELYDEIKYLDYGQKTVFIAPIFTMTAYGPSGFYEYFDGDCDESCITSVPIGYNLSPKFTSAATTIKILDLLGYPFLTDIEVDKYPEILKKFDKVIVLHNEYVTKKEFDSITQHPNVIFLHPNALYAEIEVDYEEDTISLVRGHGHPDPEIKNGFNWEFDNSDLEYDLSCENWEFDEIENGVMLNCYPEQIIFQNATLLRMIKEY